MQRLTRILVMTLFAAGFHHTAGAEVLTVFGQDLPQLLVGPDGLPYDYLPRVGHVNADAAALQFATMSTGLGTETFEDDVVGTHGPLDFGNGVTAAVTTGLFYGEVTDGSDRTAIGSNSFLGMSVPFAFTWTFSAPVSAFGFYGFALNASDGLVTLETTFADGTTRNIGIPGYEGWHRTIDDAIAKNSASFFGLLATSADEMITSITVRQGRAAANHLYFDNVSVSSQSVPEPSTIALLGLGAAVWGWRARRSRVS